MKIAAVVVPLLVAAPAFAQPASDFDEPPARTTTAETLVVVTPNAPVIVQTGAGPGAQPVMGPSMGAAAAMPAIAAPPQNEDWSNVSHINGQIVKVGERGDYLINNHKNTNIAINPFGPFFNFYDASVAHKLSQHIALSGQLSYFNKDNNTMTQVVVAVPIYFRRTFSGPFIEPGLIWRQTGDSSNCAYYGGGGGCGSSAHNWAGPELLFGWHWTFDSGLNIAWAFGVAKHVADDQMDSSSSDPDVNGYFRVGYAF